jgi:serine/threonine protein kinase
MSPTENPTQTLDGRLLEAERWLDQSQPEPMPLETRAAAREAARRMFALGEAGEDGAAEGLRDPGDMLGPYRIERLLGAGGQAFVYAAEDTQLGRLVALKVPRPGVEDRLVREAQAAGALDHARIVRLEALREHEGETFLVLEHCAGGNLGDLLERHPDGLPLDEVKRIGAEVLEALAYAHGCGVVHRDVKPGNVLFEAHGRVKLGDFGIGKQTGREGLDHSFAMSQLTQGAVGTPIYMAPEQRDPGLLAGGEIDGRADLYAFGRMLWFMLTGRSPDDYQPASRIRDGLDGSWDELIYDLTTREREKRPHSAGAVAMRLNTLPLLFGPDLDDPTLNKKTVIPWDASAPAPPLPPLPPAPPAPPKPPAPPEPPVLKGIPIPPEPPRRRPRRPSSSGSHPAAPAAPKRGLGATVVALSLTLFCLVFGGLATTLTLRESSSGGRSVQPTWSSPGQPTDWGAYSADADAPRISLGRPNQAEARGLFLQAEAALSRDETTKAEGLMRRAVRVAPKDPAAWAGLSYVLLLQEQPREARRTYERAQLLDPQRFTEQWWREAQETFRPRPR